MNWGHLLFSFSGRINRGKYWLAALIYVVVHVILTVLGYASDQSVVFLAINGIISLVTLVSGIAVGVKRLHDRNKSGWYMLLFYLLPGILFVAGIAVGLGTEDATLIGGILVLLAFAVGIWAFVELGCLRGTIGINRFGPDPLAPEVLTPPIHTH